MVWYNDDGGGGGDGGGGFLSPNEGTNWWWGFRAAINAVELTPGCPFAGEEAPAVVLMSGCKHEFCTGNYCLFYYTYRQFLIDNQVVDRFIVNTSQQEFTVRYLDWPKFDHVTNVESANRPGHFLNSNPGENRSRDEDLANQSSKKENSKNGKMNEGKKDDSHSEKSSLQRRTFLGCVQQVGKCCTGGDVDSGSNSSNSNSSSSSSNSNSSSSSHSGDAGGRTDAAFHKSFYESHM
ncbi:hypothetical protein M0802_006720 [Mischocyttarus mexicanus]|nr:hypothetical protein M0802_006720 [Mischocyttarus mexicanus]